MGDASLGDGGKSKTGTAEGPTRHYHGHRERLRQRIMEGDGSALRDYELLELLLCAFIPRVDTKPIAKELIARFGTVSAALGASPERLMEVKGIGETAAAYIRAANLLMQQAARDEIVDRPVISNWAALLNYVSLRIRHEKSEQARVLYLDRKNKLIADEKAGQGTVDHAPVYPREIARRALELSASSIILVHNHPSGDPTPSRADIDLTREIERALAPLEIKVHDHLVVGARETISMKSKGLI
ncbi:MAG TPA: DNA repair protein RadC [Hyphomonadaceae bacterium]|nr:DNA repair protein RadC [Hyphomonadaceae bacterium]HPN06430.1 DNA repair protein RadC [Hyphomonadaceae bacterium]